MDLERAVPVRIDGEMRPRSAADADLFRIYRYA